MKRQDMLITKPSLAVLILLSGLISVGSSQALPQTLPGTERLEMEGDLASELVAGVDRFLLHELESAERSRPNRWQLDSSTGESFTRSIENKRTRLREVLALRDQLAEHPVPQLNATVERSAIVGQGPNYRILEIRWPAFGNVTGEGLLLEPTKNGSPIKPVASVLAIPDCEITPEQLVGLSDGVPPEAQYARRLAESGCRVIVPLLINRADKFPGLSNREWLYRPAFELGRGLVAYELGKLLSAAKWLDTATPAGARLGVIGWGEGGMLALYAGALDTNFDVVAVSGYFDSRQDLWQQPIDRNTFGLLNEFGDAEIASLTLPRKLIIDATRGPEKSWSGERGAPWKLVSPPADRVRAEFAKLKATAASQTSSDQPSMIEANSDQLGLSEPCLKAFLESLAGPDPELAAVNQTPHALEPAVDANFRLQRQIAELDAHNQWLLRDSHYLRQERTMSQLDFSSMPAYAASADRLRTEFREKVIGSFDQPPLAPHPRTRLFKETEAWTAYEVVLDVFPDVYAYGLLLVPKGIKPGERRPVVVCQHGLEGRPQDTIGEQGFQFYSAFSAKLAERGFITFAPQNLYIFGDRFRTLQRKANLLGKTLFSIITAQHQQIVDWLQTLDFVNPQKIGFYGLSYGGKTAMRVPALVQDYCLSICSADFNEWVDKNASTRNPRTYANMSEYEIFEFDLGSTFNYAEMAALIAPRPFMVERGHFDGVADDWTVAYEYAKVQFLYAANLKRPELTEIHWFDGPHSINGKKTFEFLHRHLDWPAPAGEQK